MMISNGMSVAEFAESVDRATAGFRALGASIEETVAAIRAITLPLYNLERERKCRRELQRLYGVNWHKAPKRIKWGQR